MEQLSFLPALPPAPGAGALADGAAEGPSTAGGDVAPGSEVRPELHWDERPLVLLDGSRLRAVTAGAARARLRAGMTVTEARSRCESFETLQWDASTVEREVVRATAALLVASPQVTPVAGAPGLWWVGAGGLDGVGGERALVRTLLRVARLWHPRSRVAVADSCVAARAATWADHGSARGSSSDSSSSGGATAFIVPHGGCAAYLAPAPLALIPMDDELRQTLRALGLRTAGAFAALELQDVERRWGAAGMQAWRLARGEDRRRPVLARLDGERAVSAELATSTTTMEPVLFLVRAALDRLVSALVTDGRAAAAVAITLTLDDGRGALPSGGRAHTITRELRPARPLARVAPLFERCRGLLADWPLHAPVSGVTVRIAATAPTSSEQGDLLAPAWRDPAAADAALERLRAELGPDVVVRPVRRDSHVPDRAGAWMELDDGATTTNEAGSSRGRESVRGKVGGTEVRLGRRAETRATTPMETRSGVPTEARMEGPSETRSGIPTEVRPEVPSETLPGAPREARLEGPPGILSEVPTEARREARPAMVTERGAPPEPHDSPVALDPPHPTTAGSTRTTPLHLVPHTPSTPPHPAPSSSPLTLTPSLPTSPPHHSPATPTPTPTPLALRLLATPEPVTLDWDAGIPRTLWWRGRGIPVQRADGPERLAGDWWTEPYRRDYWRCSGADGEFLVYRDTLHGSTRPTAPQWYLQGWYD